MLSSNHKTNISPSSEVHKPFHSQHSKSSSLELKPELTTTLINTGWNKPNICSMPSIYMLELSSRFIDCTLHKPAIIMKNLVDCFRILSLRVQYIENPTGAVLWSPEQVEMYVCLWNVEDGQQICVEVQRRRGDSLTFHKYARHILEAASGDFDSDKYLKNDTHIDSRYLKEAEKLMKNQYARESDDNKRFSFETIDYILKLINDERLDSRILGMKSLSILSDVRRSSMSVAHTISRCVLFREGDDEQYGKMQDFIIYAIQKQSMPDREMILDDMDFEDDSDDESYLDDKDYSNIDKPSEYQESMRCLMNYGFTVLANCLEVISIVVSYQGDVSGRNVSSCPSGSLYVTRILHEARKNCNGIDLCITLLDVLGNGNVQPHNASEAAKCLNLLCRLSPEARDYVLTNNGSQIAHHGQQIGIAMHSRLEKESTELLHGLFGNHN